MSTLVVARNGQVALELALDHGRVGPEVVEHGEEGLEQAVGGEERVGQRHPAHDRARHVALVPLVAGQLARPSTGGRAARPASPLIRSHDRLFILWGIADDPTWPGRNPSVASSWPAISRMVVARLAGPAAACTSAATTSRSSERGYTWPTLVSVGLEAEVAGDRRLELRRPVSARAEQVEHVLLGAHRALDARAAGSGRAAPRRGARARSSSSPALANRLPSVVAWAGTLWLRPAITRSACSAASSASRASAATIRSRTSVERGRAPGAARRSR